MNLTESQIKQVIQEELVNLHEFEGIGIPTDDASTAEKKRPKAAYRQARKVAKDFRARVDLGRESFIPRRIQSALPRLDKLAKAAQSDVQDSPEANARLGKIQREAARIILKLNRRLTRTRLRRYAPGGTWWKRMLDKTGRSTNWISASIYELPRRKGHSGRLSKKLDTVASLLDPTSFAMAGPQVGGALLRTAGQQLAGKGAASFGSHVGAATPKYFEEYHLKQTIKDILLEDEFRNIALGGKNVRTPEEAGGTTTMMKCDKAGNCKPTSEWETQSGEKVQITHKPSLEDPKERTQGLKSFIKHVVAPEFAPITNELIKIFKDGKTAIKRVRNNPMRAATKLFYALYGTSKEDVRPGRAVINILWKKFKGKMRELQKYFVNIILKAAKMAEKWLNAKPFERALTFGSG